MVFKDDSIPLVSVIIPSYNHQKFIKDTIRSIEEQTYPNIELLIIDDGSKDNSCAAIEEELKKNGNRFSRIYFCSQSNSGVAKTLNKLLKEAKGEYVYISASDDVSAKHSITSLVDVLESDRKAVLAVGNMAFIDEDNHMVNINESFYPVEEGEGYKTWADLFGLNQKYSRHRIFFGKYCDLLFGNYIPNGYLIRKCVIDHVGGYDERVYLEDWYLNLQLSKFGAFKYLNKVNLFYRLHRHNTIHSEQFIGRTKKIFFQIYKIEFEYCSKRVCLLVLTLAFFILY